MPNPLDLTLEPEVYDGAYFRSTLRAEMKKLGHDFRDDPAIDRGIEQICTSRLQRAPDKKTFSAIDQNGTPLRVAYPLRQLAQELAAKIEEESGPTIEEVMEAKRASTGYAL
jgi:hypothetical protein